MDVLRLLAWLGRHLFTLGLEATAMWDDLILNQRVSVGRWVDFEGWSVAIWEVRPETRKDFASVQFGHVSVKFRWPM